MVNKRRILIIENQFTQFKEIIRLLCDSGFEIYPDEKCFKEFLDWVRIYLNPRYSQDRRNFFIEKITEKLNEFNPEILIIDHILVGNHNSEDGIDLALKFRSKGIKQPFLFFSRTKINNIDICDRFPLVSLEKDWIFKGYSGADILEEKFFKDVVIPKICSLLKKNLSCRIIDKLNEKKPKIVDDKDRNIVNKTDTLIDKINNSTIELEDEFLFKLEQQLSDSQYLELLNSNIINNEHQR